MHYPMIACALLAGASLAQVPARPWTPECVLYDDAFDGRLWARGSNWKASFGADGFVYHPFVPGAEHGRELRFRITAVRVGGARLPFAAVAAPARHGDRVEFDRGLVRELYDLGLDEVEQTFEIAATGGGDVEVELAVDAEVRSDPTVPGLQLGADGAVHYGTAFVRRGARRHAIETVWTGSAILLHVPAALRGEGVVVIDPIITTKYSGGAGAVYNPDVAWDETYQRYLLVFESRFTGTDRDIWCELFDRNGDRIPQSAAAIDMSSADWIRPRVADMRDTRRFVVAAEVADPGLAGQHMIYVRSRDAGGATAMHAAVRISDPTFPGNNFTPSVGGDPSGGAIPRRCLVVWTNDAANDYNALGRLVDQNDAPSGGLLFIADGVHQLNTNVQVSRSNGAGIVPDPGWFAVYSRQDAAGWNVYGRRVDSSGGLGLEVPLDTTAGDDLYPRPSSPIGTPDGKTQYLITYEHQSPPEARAVVATLAPGLNTYVRKNLTAEFGVGPFWLRVDSDGTRYAVVAGDSTIVRVRTFATVGDTLLLHDGPHALLGNLSAILPEVASRRSSGGAAGEYGIVCVQTSGTPQLPLSRYVGQTAGASTAVHPTGCGGLQLDFGGSNALGGAMQFSLSNVGGGTPGFGFGWANPNPFPICPGCALGLRTDLPISIQLGLPTYAVAIPSDPSLVGATLATQGLCIGPGTCLGALTFSDTVAFTIR
ncbi:MAG: hypothetical protein KDE27_08855 [Planctomycetes bacterium]|nr:hypothetical protein [Planctomycetota bacterium]